MVVSTQTETTAVIIAALPLVVKHTSMVVQVAVVTAATEATTAVVTAEVVVANSADLEVVVATLVAQRLLTGVLGAHTVEVEVALTLAQTKTTPLAYKKETDLL